MKMMYAFILLVITTASAYAHNAPDTSGGNSSPNTSHLYLKCDLSGGFSQTTTGNLPANLTPKGKVTAGGGISLVLDNGRTGMFSIGTHYQAAGVRIADKDISGDGKDNNIRLHYLKMPIQYHLFANKAKNFYVGGGGYWAALLVPAVQKVRGAFNLDDMRKLDAGFMASTGVKLSPKWMLQANAQWGMVDIDRSQGANLGKNNQYFLTLSFLTSARKTGYDLKLNKKV